MCTNKKFEIFFIINNLGRIVSVMIKVLAKMSILNVDLFLSTTMKSIFFKKKPSYKHAWLEAVKQIIHWEQHKLQLIGCHCINTLKHAKYWIKWLTNIKLTIALIRGKDIYRRETQPKKSLTYNARPDDTDYQC